MKSEKKEKARVWAEEAESPWRGAKWRDRWRQDLGVGLDFPTHL